MESIPAREVKDVRFDETVDVVVVGLGVAGSSAVVAARQAGADVLAVERGVAPGGTSANSGGLIYLGGGTALQRACGFDDSTGNMAAFLMAALGPDADEDRVATYCEGSPDHFDWLVDIGVPFRAAFCDEPNRESADDAGLLFSGGEDSYPFDEVAIPVPRGHKPQYIDSAGGFLMNRLGAAVTASAARVTTDTTAEAIVVDDGEVVGLQVRTDVGLRTIQARGGVVLAAGGFIHNEAMVAEQCPTAHVPDAAWRIGTPNDDGRGIRMGVGAGAATARLHSFECALPLGPPHRLARGILVNRHGKRFINEDAYTGRIGLHALRDQDGFVYMITDDVIHEPNILGLRVAFAAATPEELAADLGVPPDHWRAPCTTTTKQPLGARTRSSTSAHRSCNRSVCRRPAASVPSTYASTTAPSTRRSRSVVWSPMPTASHSTVPAGRSRACMQSAGLPPAWRPATTPVVSVSVTGHSSAGGPAVTPPPGPEIRGTPRSCQLS